MGRNWGIGNWECLAASAQTSISKNIYIRKKELKISNRFITNFKM